VTDVKSFYDVDVYLFEKQAWHHEPGATLEIDIEA
jgi:hypothetical protein